MRADKTKVTRLLKTARGQIDGILKMIEEDQYCIDILNQMLASEAVLRRAEREVLRAHMRLSAPMRQSARRKLRKSLKRSKKWNDRPDGSGFSRRKALPLGESVYGIAGSVHAFFIWFAFSNHSLLEIYCEICYNYLC